MDIPRLKLGHGGSIPQVGLGVWRMRDEQECRQAVLWALEVGYRHIDTAQIYGNEQFVGAAVDESGISRSDLFITTKIWQDNSSSSKLEPSLDESLTKLRTDYVDLLLLHWPFPETRIEAWKKLEEMLRQGKTRAIGVSNYTVRHLEELFAQSNVKPAVNQVELHIYLQQPELIQFCHNNDIVVEAYSPLMHGGGGMDDPIVMELAQKHGKTPAQIMLRWCVQAGTVPLPKSTHKERLIQNLSIFDFELDAADMAMLKKLDRNHRNSNDPNAIP